MIRGPARGLETRKKSVAGPLPTHWRGRACPRKKETRSMKLALIAVGTLALMLAPAISPAPAEAAGCLKGALVGGVAGHYAGHHAVLGALGGCIVGHHLANQQEKEKAAAAAQGAQAPQPA